MQPPNTKLLTEIRQGLVLCTILLWTVYLLVTNFHPAGQLPGFVVDNQSLFLSSGLNQNWQMFAFGRPDGVLNLTETITYADGTAVTNHLKGTPGLLPSGRARLFEWNSSFFTAREAQRIQLLDYLCRSVKHGTYPVRAQLEQQRGVVVSFGVATDQVVKYEEPTVYTRTCNS
jgi:hypothetical protein